MSSCARIAGPFVLTALLVACGGGGARPTPPPTPPTPPPPAPVVDKPVSDGPTAEESLAWALAAVTAGNVTRADVEARFAPSFLTAVPADKVVAIFADLHRQLPPVKVVTQEGKPPLVVSAILETAGGNLKADLVMTEATPRLIRGFLLKPASSEPPARTYDEARAQLGKAGARGYLYIAELDKGRCVPAQNVGPQRLALGSTFKLWVLLALDEKLRTAKGLTWDSKLAVSEASKSLPSGTMQDEAAGTEHTLLEFATQMISISDNTATDHLIDFVGDAAVERALKLAHHGKPALNIPFLRTREMFGLKLAATPEEAAAYRKGKLAAKRALLATLRARPIDLAKAEAEWTAPRALDLEWFADGTDVCNVLGTLGRRARFDPAAPLFKALSKNPGLGFDKARWTWIGYKGGSEPGVMSLAWLMRRVDGRWFVVAVTVNDDARKVNEGLILGAAQGAVKLLGDEAGPAVADVRAPSGW